MSGRARTRARGRARGRMPPLQPDVPGPGATADSAAQQAARLQPRPGPPQVPLPAPPGMPVPPGMPAPPQTPRTSAPVPPGAPVPSRAPGPPGTPAPPGMPVPAPPGAPAPPQVPQTSAPVPPRAPRPPRTPALPQMPRTSAPVLLGALVSPRAPRPPGMPALSQMPRTSAPVLPRRPAPPRVPAPPQAVAPEQPRGAEGGAQLSGELPVEARLQAMTVRPRRPPGFFQDLVVNTRQHLDHVRHLKIGSKGRVITIITNHFRVSCFQQTAYKYNISYRPDIEDVELRAQLLFQHERTLGGLRIFDGNSLLLPRRLRNQNMEFVSRTADGFNVRITVKFSRELEPNHPDYLRYYNVLFRRTLKQMRYTQIGRNYYNEDKSENKRIKNLDVWPGFITSILPYERNLTLCADMTHKLVRIHTAYDLIANTRHLPIAEAREFVTRELVGAIVFTDYNNKTYRVHAIDWNQSPSDTFEKSDGRIVSYEQYYWEKYRTYITDVQPLLVSWGRWRKGQGEMPRQPIRLVPQLCALTGITKEILSSRQDMSRLTKEMKPKPNSRTTTIKKFIQNIQDNRVAQNELRRWQLSFDTDFLTISGRVLEEVQIFQCDKLVQVNPQLSDWSKASRNMLLHRAESINCWLLLHTKECTQTATFLERKLQSVAPSMGITIKKAEVHEVDDDPYSYIAALKKFVRSNTQMVVCILPDEEKNRYDEIKRYLCVQCPVPSQCVLEQTLLSIHSTPIVTKIAQQMNCKLGGALWKVDIGLQKTMFIGIDCFHDIVNRKNSIAGFVASTNEELTQWYSQCVFQEPGEELVAELRSCLEAALKVWFKNRAYPPCSIVVYRDGVGDGQLQALLDHEIPQLVNYLEKEYRYSVKLTFIVVKKRINTRFFVKYNEVFDNPPSGTVVDMELTRRQWYDFYIVSQSSYAGTVTPTHYNVIYDTVGLDPDTVQRITYKLCHMYYNLSGIIRVPAPCHYAHKLAYLVGQNIHQMPHISLWNSLYYL